MDYSLQVHSKVLSQGGKKGMLYFCELQVGNQEVSAVRCHTQLITETKRQRNSWPRTANKQHVKFYSCSEG